MPTRSALGQLGQLRQTGQGVEGGTGGHGGVGQGIDEEEQDDGEEEKDHLSAAEHFDTLQFLFSFMLSLSILFRIVHTVLNFVRLLPKQLSQ